ncbi:MAG: hypothetical protein HS126_14385 [Anaerolineales bacterium]|nr:hypothetical protein [Anaerolineales bacterium]
MSQRDHLRRVLINLHRRLQILEERKALYGLDASPTILTEIEDIQVAIAEQQEKLTVLEEMEKPDSIAGFDAVRNIPQKPFRLSLADPFSTLESFSKESLVVTQPNQELSLTELKTEISPASLLPAEPALTNLPAFTELPDSATIEDMVKALETERHRLAALLQNNVMTPLRLLLAQANIYEQSLQPNPVVQGAMMMLITLARQIFQQAQDLATNLHPTILESLGLTPALESLTGQAMRVHGLQITLALEPLRERLSASLELALFRVAQEALDEAINQGRASHIVIQLVRRDEQLIFSLTDNGAARPVDAALPTARPYLEKLGGVIQTGMNRYGNFEVTVSFKDQHSGARVNQ